MFFYPTALAEPGLHQFGKQLFLKSAESRFPKTAETDFSDFCRNKITIYIIFVLRAFCFCLNAFLAAFSAFVASRLCRILRLLTASTAIFCI